MRTIPCQLLKSRRPNSIPLHSPKRRLCTLDCTRTYSARPTYHISGRTDDDEPQPSTDGDGRLKTRAHRSQSGPVDDTEEIQRNPQAGGVAMARAIAKTAVAMTITGAWSKKPPLAGITCHGRRLFLCRLRPFSHRRQGGGKGVRRLAPEQSWMITRILISRGEGGIRASGHVCFLSIGLRSYSLFSRARWWQV